MIYLDDYVKFIELDLKTLTIVEKSYPLIFWKCWENSMATLSSYPMSLLKILKIEWFLKYLNNLWVIIDCRGFDRIPLIESCLHCRCILYEDNWLSLVVLPTIILLEDLSSLVFLFPLFGSSLCGNNYNLEDIQWFMWVHAPPLVCIDPYTTYSFSSSVFHNIVSPPKNAAFPTNYTERKLALNGKQSSEYFVNFFPMFHFGSTSFISLFLLIHTHYFACPQLKW